MSAVPGDAGGLGEVEPTSGAPQYFLDMGGRVGHSELPANRKEVCSLDVGELTVDGKGLLGRPGAIRIISEGKVIGRGEPPGAIWGQ